VRPRSVASDSPFPKMTRAEPAASRERMAKEKTSAYSARANEARKRSADGMQRSKEPLASVLQTLKKADKDARENARRSVQAEPQQPDSVGNVGRKADLIGLSLEYVPKLPTLAFPGQKAGCFEPLPDGKSFDIIITGVQPKMSEWLWWMLHLRIPATRVIMYYRKEGTFDGPHELPCSGPMQFRVIPPNHGRECPAYLDHLKRGEMADLTAFVHEGGSDQWHVADPAIFWRNIEGAYLSLLKVPGTEHVQSQVLDLNRVPCIVRDASEFRSLAFAGWSARAIGGKDVCSSFPHWEYPIPCPYNVRQWREILPQCVSKTGNASALEPLGSFESILNEQDKADRKMKMDKKVKPRIRRILQKYIKPDDRLFFGPKSFDPCCAQFVVPRAHATRYPAELFSELLAVSIDVTVKDHVSSRVFEQLWLRLFGATNMTLDQVEAYARLEDIDRDALLVRTFERPKSNTRWHGQKIMSSIRMRHLKMLQFEARKRAKLERQKREERLQKMRKLSKKPVQRKGATLEQRRRESRKQQMRRRPKE